TLEMAPLEIRHRSVRPISAKHAQASRFLQQSQCHSVLDTNALGHGVFECINVWSGRRDPTTAHSIRYCLVFILGHIRRRKEKAFTHTFVAPFASIIADIQISTSISSGASGSTVTWAIFS